MMRSPMVERSIFHVRQVGDHWVVRREDATVDALRDPSKEETVSGAFQLAEAFEASVVIVHYKHGLTSGSIAATAVT